MDTNPQSASHSKEPIPATMKVEMSHEKGFTKKIIDKVKDNNVDDREKSISCDGFNISLEHCQPLEDHEQLATKSFSLRQISTPVIPYSHPPSIRRRSPAISSRRNLTAIFSPVSVANITKASSSKRSLSLTADALSNYPIDTSSSDSLESTDAMNISSTPQGALLLSHSFSYASSSSSMDLASTD
jgi:hypothetical protein